jgi:hypothetical protein
MERRKKGRTKREDGKELDGKGETQGKRPKESDGIRIDLKEKTGRTRGQG